MKKKRKVWEGYFFFTSSCAIIGIVNNNIVVNPGNKAKLLQGLSIDDTK